MPKKEAGMMIRVIEAMLRSRKLAFAVLLLSLGVASFWAAKIRVRFQYRDFYSYPANKDFPAFDRYSKEFGDPGGNVVLLLQSEDIFKRQNLEYIEQVSRDLEPSPLFSRIRSLSTTRLIRAVGDSVETGRIMEHVPATQQGIEELRKTALDSPLLLRRLISKDGKMTAILAEMRTPAAIATVAEEAAAIEAVQTVIDKRKAPKGLDVMLTGAPSIEVGATHALARDQLVLTPAVMTIIVIALILTFRSIHGVLLVLSTVTVSIIWTAGVFGAIGRPVDIVGSVIPTTLLVYGAVDPIFVLTRYLNKVELLGDRRAAILQALREMLLPCFLTSVTTALGFAAFVTASMPTVRYLGVVVAAGVLFSFVTTVTVLPLLLSVIEPPRRALSSLGSQQKLDRLLANAWRALNARRGLVFAISLGLLTLGVIAGRALKINDAYIDTSPKSSARAAARLAETKLSGVVRYVVYLEGAPGQMKKPEVLQAIAAVDQAAERDSMINSSISLPDLLAEANRGFNFGEPSAYVVPTSPTLIAQYLTLIDPDDRSDFVNDDYSKTHIRMLATDLGGLEGKRFRESLKRIVDEQGFEKLGVKVTLTGNGIVTYRELERIVIEILWGFVVAFGIVLLFELLLFRSLRVALISIIPNLLPLGACFLAMHLTGVGFRLDTSLVLCISIGGLFNTTIHIIARIQQQIRAGATDADEIVGNALRAVGPASFYTAAILSAGFSVLLLSSFPGLRALGGFALVTMLTAFFADAVFTTTFMRIFYNWRGVVSRSKPPEPLFERAAAGSTGAE